MQSRTDTSAILNAIEQIKRTTSVVIYLWRSQGTRAKMSRHLTRRLTQDMSLLHHDNIRVTQNKSVASFSLLLLSILRYVPRIPLGTQDFHVILPVNILI